MSCCHLSTLALVAALATSAAAQGGARAAKPVLGLDLTFSSGAPATTFFHRDHDPKRHHDTCKVFHHVRALDGTLLTKGNGGMFQHHKGLFIGWNRTKWNGQRFDFWHMPKQELQVFRGFLPHDAMNMAEGAQVCAIEWITPAGEVVIAERRGLQLTEQRADYYTLHLRSELRRLEALTLVAGGVAMGGAAMTGGGDVGGAGGSAANGLASNGLASNTVELREIAEVTRGRGPSSIRHRDRERVVKVTAQIDERVTTSAAVNEALMERIRPLREANPQIAFQQGGEYERTQESLESLRDAFGVALLLIFTILATQFRSLLQPFVVMLAIPLSFIGVVIGFFVSGAPVGLIALIGVVGLAGIVVNDSLVLVDFINQRRRSGTPVDEAVVEASKLRLRPIFLTSITTVAGLFPLALAGAASPLLSPMATAIAWGLSFATVLTLVLIPCLYRVTVDAERGLSRVFGPAVRWMTDPGEALDEDPAESAAE